MALRVAVAASGGRDSTALLHATARAAHSLGIEVWALHVHHGLSPQADDWQAHLRRQCARWARAGLPVYFECARLQGRPAAGDSVEAWARSGRYAALAEMARAHGIDTVLLAHHRRDQAETVLLQALRGGGPAGAAAMPAQAQRAGLHWLRPWLDQSTRAIEAYVRRHRLSHIEDESNRDERFSRNRLRRQVWPPLLKAFPEAESALGTAARRMAEAAACLRELAQEDLSRCQNEGGNLSAAQLAMLSPARRGNLLRHWLQQAQPQPVPESLVQRLSRESKSGRGGRWWPATGGRVRLDKGTLAWDPERPDDVPDPGPGFASREDGRTSPRKPR